MEFYIIFGKIHKNPTVSSNDDYNLRQIFCIFETIRRNKNGHRSIRLGENKRYISNLLRRISSSCDKGRDLIKYRYFTVHCGAHRNMQQQPYETTLKTNMIIIIMAIMPLSQKA